MALRPCLVEGWNDKVFGQQRRRHLVVCIAFNGGSARSESQRRIFV